MKEERNIVLAIVFSLITCGIYAIYWFIVLTDEAKEAAGDTELASGGLAFVFTLLTCGIYGYYWAYRMGQIMNKAGEKNNLSIADNAVLYLVFQLLGLGIVNYCLIQNDLNKITRTLNGTKKEA